MRNFVTAFEKALHELLTPKVTLDYFWTCAQARVAVDVRQRSRSDVVVDVVCRV